MASAGPDGRLDKTPRRRRRGKGQDRRPGPQGDGAHDLFEWKDLPDYLKDNRFIRTGYRANTGLAGSLRSLFRVHNESGNVWSHLLGFFFFVFLVVTIVRTPPTPVSISHAHASSMWESISERLHNTSSSMLHRIWELEHELVDLLHLDASDGNGSSSGQHASYHLRDRLLDTLHSLDQRLGQPRPSDLVSTLTHPRHLNVSVNMHGLQDIGSRLSSIPQGVAESWGRLRRSIRGLAPHGHVPGFGGGGPLQGLPIPEVLDRWLAEVVRKAVQWPVPRWPTYLFMACAMACLLLSAVCHLLACCSQHVSAVVWRFDYAGIVAMIVGSFYPAIYYGFLCVPFVLSLYLTSITLFGTLTLVVSLFPVFQSKKWHLFRAMCFLSLGVCGVVPWGHIIATLPMRGPVLRALCLDAAMAVSYLCGVTFYTSRVPEKWFPGKFDLLLHSHQIFHMFVVLGAYLHYLGVMELLSWRDSLGGCALHPEQAHEAASLAMQVNNGDRHLELDAFMHFLRSKLQHLWNLHAIAPEMECDPAMLPSEFDFRDVALLEGVCAIRS